MIFIYNCYGGTHSSSLASAVHLGKLPQHKVPSGKEILKIDCFNKLTYKDMGRIIYRGTDDEGNKVYSVGRGTSKLLIPCLVNFINIIAAENGFNGKVVFSNMSPTVPLAMTFGGFFSRGIGIDAIGVPLLVIGAKQEYKNIVDIVIHTKEAAHSSNEMVLVLENKN